MCALKLLVHPLLEGLCVLRTAEKVLHEIVSRHGSARFQHQAPVSHGSIAGKEILLVKLLKEILGYDLVPHVGVNGRRIAPQVGKGCIHVSVGVNRSEQGVMPQIIEGKCVEVNVLRIVFVGVV